MSNEYAYQDTNVCCSFWMPFSNDFFLITEQRDCISASWRLNESS